MKEITVAISKNSFTVELDVKDSDLINTVLKALKTYVTGGIPIKVRQTYMNSPSDSIRIISTIISDVREMEKWRRETGQLISVLRSHT